MELALNRLIALAVLFSLAITAVMFLKSGTEDALGAVTNDFENQITGAFALQDDILNG